MPIPLRRFFQRLLYAHCLNRRWVFGKKGHCLFACTKFNSVARVGEVFDTPRSHVQLHSAHVCVSGELLTAEEIKRTTVSVPHKCYYKADIRGQTTCNYEVSVERKKLVQQCINAILCLQTTR